MGGQDGFYHAGSKVGEVNCPSMFVSLTATSLRCFRVACSQQLVLVKSNPNLYGGGGGGEIYLAEGEIEQLLQRSGTEV